MTDRIRRLREALPEEAQALLITSPENRFYVSGIRTSAGGILLTRDECYFFADFRYIEAVRARVPHMTPVLLQGRLCAAVAEKVRELGTCVLGFEEKRMQVEQYGEYMAALPGVKLLPCSGVLLRLRQLKDAAELQAIRQAQRITDAGFMHILDYIRPGRTEREIALELEFFMRRYGATGIAFDVIAVSGKNSSMPHGVPGDKKVERGELLTMDFGALYNGYCADMTRTVAVGEISDEMRRVYRTVLAAQRAALEVIRPGVVCAEVDGVARRLIDEAGYEGCFGHGLGHSVGIEIHEDPGFRAGCLERTEPGMVITVEPGVYLEGRFGVRIEDLVVITEDGCENLTTGEKELIVL